MKEQLKDAFCVFAITLAVIMPVGVYAIWRAENHLQYQRENLLHLELQTIRRAIDDYTMVEQHAPQSLHELVKSGHLNKVPRDPITNSAQTWVLVFETIPSADNKPVGIRKVHSGAPGVDSNGKSYSDY